MAAIVTGLMGLKKMVFICRLPFFEAKGKEDDNGADVQADQASYQNETEQFSPDEVLDSLELSTTIGLSAAIDRFRATRQSGYLHKSFWEEVFKRIPENHASLFLRALSQAENVCRYDVQEALACFPESWHNKVSVKKV